MTIVTCPTCGSTDAELVRVLLDERRRIRCTACGGEWIRGLPKDPTFLERPEAWATGHESMTPLQFGALKALHDALGTPFRGAWNMTKAEASAHLEKAVRALASLHLEGVHGQDPAEVRGYSSELQRRLHRDLHAVGGQDHSHRAAGFGPYGDFL